MIPQSFNENVLDVKFGKKVTGTCFSNRNAKFDYLSK